MLSLHRLLRRTAGAVATLAALATLAPGASAQGLPERTLRLGHGIAEDHPLGQGAKRFAELVDKATGGRTKVKVYPATQLGSEVQMISALRGGVQEMLITSSAPVATLSKPFLLFDLPFLLDSEAEADALLDGPVGQRLLDGLDDKALVGLCYWENGFRHVTNSRRAVTRADDLSGLKLRVMQNPVYIDSFKALGANAVPMPFTELYSAMETRAIDAQENPVAIIAASKFYEVQKHVTLTKHAYAPYVVLVSRAFWDKLQPTERDGLRGACREARDFQRTLIRQQTVQQLDMLRKSGMTVSELAPGEAEKLRARVKPVVERYVQEIGPALVADAQRAVASARAKP
jgi:tripartite ATP-independent transporter DctP family solute receptor